MQKIVSAHESAGRAPDRERGPPAWPIPTPAEVGDRGGAHAGPAGELELCHALAGKPFNEQHAAEITVPPECGQDENGGIALWRFAVGANSIPDMPGRRKSTPEHADPRPIPRTYVRGWRKYRRLTLEQLAERSGLSVATISGIERSVHDFSGKTLLQLALALDTTPGALLTSDPAGLESEIWKIWADIGQQNRVREATAVLRALRDSQRD